MLASRASISKSWACDSLAQPGIFLPLLYSTPTIQHRQYTKVSRGTRTRRNIEIDDSPQPWRFRKAQGAVDRRDSDKDFYYRHLKPDDRESHDATTNDSQRRVPGRGSRVRTDHVPFERPEQEGKASTDDFVDSTITPSEKKAFEKLFSLRKARAEETDGVQTGKQGKKDMTEHASSLDAILDAAMEPQSSPTRNPSQLPAALRPMAEEARARERAAPKEDSTPDNRAKEAAIAENLDCVTTRMQRAGTDIELWQVLQTQVFNRVAALELDPSVANTARHRDAVKAWQQLVRSEKGTTRAKAKPATDRAEQGTISDLQVMTANLPALLTTFMHIIQTSFPSSSHLGLAVLPSLKKLGPSAFTLGATTELYNAHMSLLYTKYTDLLSMVDTLAEMDKEVYEFDEGTLRLLDRILNDARKVGRGESGEGVRAMWATERMRRGVRGCVQWRRVVEERRQEEALRRAREAEMDRSEQHDSDSAVAAA